MDGHEGGAAPDRLVTARLVLEPVGEADVDPLLALWNDPVVRRMHGLGTEPLPPAAVLRWLRTPDRALCWLARAGGEGAAAGVVELSARERPPGVREIGVAVAEPVRGRGVGREMVEAVCRWAFARLEAAAVRAEVRVDNEAALRLFERAGFSPIGEAAGGSTLWLERRAAAGGTGGDGGGRGS
jgi:RimJ/RimL family protein N-acetyltransferase